MKIRDFRIIGTYPTLSVEAEIEESGSDSSGNSEGKERNSPNGSVTVTIGPWNYVSLLNEAQLKSLVHLVYERQKHQPTEAMINLTGAPLDDATDQEMP